MTEKTETTEASDVDEAADSNETPKEESAGASGRGLGLLNLALVLAVAVAGYYWVTRVHVQQHAETDSRVASVGAELEMIGDTWSARLGAMGETLDTHGGDVERLDAGLHRLSQAPIAPWVAGRGDDNEPT